jgi:hypothetical protein
VGGDPESTARPALQAPWRIACMRPWRPTRSPAARKTRRMRGLP